jgi:hypothetical protein
MCYLTILSTLGPERDYSRVGGSHSVIKEAYGHTGCCNALAWDEGGTRLASAGDDTKFAPSSFPVHRSLTNTSTERICIWKPGLGKIRPEEQLGDSPMMAYGLSDVVETGHTRNIFSCKWAPAMPSRLFTCAGDAQVRFPFSFLAWVLI